MKIQEVERKEQGIWVNKLKVIDERTKQEKGIELIYLELDLLMFVAKHRVVTFESIYRFMSLHISKSRYGLYNRLRKFVDNKLLYVNDYLQVTPWSTLKVFSITRRGLDVLYQTNCFSQAEFQRFLYNRRLTSESPKGKTVSDHAVVTSEVSSILIPYHYHRNAHFDYGKPSDFPFLRKDSDSFWVQPDFIQQVGENTFVYLEIDTGSERVNRIQEKVERYDALKDAHPDKHHIVIFVVIDESMRTNGIYPSNRRRRLRSIKRTFSSIRSDDGMDVWALPLKDFAEQRDILRLVEPVGTGADPVAHVQEVVDDIHDFQDNLSYIVTTQTWYDEVCVLLFENLSNEFIRHVAFVPMIHGDVHTFRRFQSLANREDDRLRHVDLFVAVYDEYSSLKDGVIPTDIVTVSHGPVEYLHRHVLSTYVHMTIDHDSFLTFFKDVGLSGNKESIPFEDVLNRGVVNV